MDKPWKNDFGIWIYPTLPPGLRVACKADFLDDTGQLIMEKNFLVKSFHYNRYEAHKTKAGFSEKWGVWLAEDHIFCQI